MSATPCAMLLLLGQHACVLTVLCQEASLQCMLYSVLLLTCLSCVFLQAQGRGGSSVQQAAQVAELLVESALYNGSTDNATAIVLLLHWDQ